MSGTNDYTITKSTFGKSIVHYRCVGCQSRLRSPLKNAAKTESCPNCHVQFVVPGKSELQELHKQQEQERAKTATLPVMKVHHDSEFQVLAHQLNVATKLEQARADAKADLLTEQLESEYLSMLSTASLKKKNLKEATLVQLTQLTADNLRIVQQKKWPDNAKERAISDILEVRKRIARQIMGQSS